MNLSTKKRPWVYLTIFMALTAFLVIPSTTLAQRPGTPRAKAKAKAHHKKGHHPKAHHKRAHAKRVAHHHYKHLPRRGAVVTTLPSGVVIVKHRGSNFHYHNGVFYKSKGRRVFI